jgi:hypothetical protein
MASVPFVRRVVQLALLPAIGVSAVLLFAALLVSLRLEKAVGDLIEDRASLIALQLTHVVEGGLRFGIRITDQSEAHRKMKSLIDSDAEVQTIALFDDTGERLMVQDRDGKIPGLDPRLVKRVLSQRPSKTTERYTRTWRANGEEHIVMQARDAIGSTGAVVWVIYSANAAQVAFSATLDKLAEASMVMLVGAALLIFGLVFIIWAKWERHVEHAHAHLGEVPPTVSATERANPLPDVPLTEALAQLADVERELKVVSIKLTALGA